MTRASPGAERPVLGERCRGLLALCRYLRSDGGKDRAGSPSVGWDAIVGIADQQLLAPALWSSLKQKGLIAGVPERKADHLRRTYRHNLRRNFVLRRDTFEICCALNDAGVVPLLLKGSLYLFDSTFSDLGARVMSDIDLAVRPNELVLSTKTVEGLGWQRSPGRAFVPHETKFLRPGAAGELELHSSAGHRRLPTILRTEEIWANSEIVDIGGPEVRALSPTHRVLHNVLHAQMQDLNHAVGGIALRQLHTFAKLVESLGARIDWDRITRIADEHHTASMVNAYTYQANMLFHVTVPGSLGFGPSALTHHIRCLCFYELGWPADVARNIAFAFGPEYLADEYGQGERGLGLALARASHAVRLLREHGWDVLRETRTRRV